MPIRMRYAIVGGILGLGAPLGSLALRIFSHPPGEWVTALLTEWQTATFYYIYMSIGTVVAFSLFGLLVGKDNEALSDLSTTDGLTGLYNHRYLQEQLSEEIDRSDRYATPVTCLMVDIDDFKKVNDQHGHPFGDEVLRTTAGLIRNSVRRTD